MDHAPLIEFDHRREESFRSLALDGMSRPTGRILKSPDAKYRSYSPLDRKVVRNVLPSQSPTLLTWSEADQRRLHSIKDLHRQSHHRYNYIKSRTIQSSLTSESTPNSDVIRNNENQICATIIDFHEKPLLLLLLFSVVFKILSNNGFS